jgi:hypothetical protein
MSDNGTEFHINFTQVKEAVEAQSGRFEFFKQMLTLGLAGIAGSAAILIDSTKIPSDLASIITISIFGTALLVTSSASAMGLSTYANFLRAIYVRNGGFVSPKHPLKNEPPFFEGQIITHARATFFALCVGVLALLVFAGFRLFAPLSLNPEAALSKTRLLITKEILQANQSSRLDHVEISGRDFLIDYIIKPEGTKYAFRVSRDSRYPGKSCFGASRSGWAEIRCLF